MIETELTIPATAAQRNKLGITDASRLSKAEADFTAVRLAELQCAPIRDGFDTAHLQNIHRHLFQDLYDWAGDLRPTNDRELQQSLDRITDSLRADNHLRGPSAEEWTGIVAQYVCELGALEPFPAGNSVTLREFTIELARKNQLSLQCEGPAIANGENFAVLQQEGQSASLRRLIMLAMDKDPIPLCPTRSERLFVTIDHSVLFGNPFT